MSIGQIPGLICCKNIEDTRLQKVQMLGVAGVGLSVVALGIIFGHIVGAYYYKGIKLCTAVDPKTLAKWLEGAKWTGVIGGSCYGLMALAKGIDLGLQRMNRGSNVYKEKSFGGSRSQSSSSSLSAGWLQTARSNGGSYVEEVDEE